MSIISSNVANSSSAPNYKILPNRASNGQVLFDNVTPGAFGTNTAVGVFAANNKGWELVTQDLGPIANYAVVNAGTTNSYTNADTFNITGGTVNVTGNIVANSTGYVTGLSFANLSGLFANIAGMTMTINAASGHGANISFTLGGGRVGRIRTEILVPMNGISANNSLVP